MLASFARLLFQYRWSLLAASLLLLVLGSTYGIGVFDHLKNGGLTDSASESFRLSEQVNRDFPDSHISLLLLMHSPDRTVDNADYKTAANALLTAVKQDPATGSLISYYDTGDTHFVSKDRRSTYAIISFQGPQPPADAYLRLRRNLRSPVLSITFGGPIVADYEIDQQVQNDLPRAESLSFPILLILLVIIFRSIIAAVLPLFIGGLSILTAFVLTRYFASFMDISVFAANIISLLGLGLAIDYSLLFVSRFRDEIAAGKDIPTSLEVTLRTAGESIFFSGCTVALSLLGMLVFPESFLRSMGLGGALATLVAMVSSLTVLPAILAVLGANINRWPLPLPFLRPARAAHRSRFWFDFSHQVMRWAGWVVPLTLGILLLLGVPFLHTRFANAGPESLPDQFQSRLSAEALRHDFGQNDNAPIQVLVTLPTSPLDPTQLLDMASYVARLRKLPGVQHISSLVSIDPRIPADSYNIFYSMDLPEVRLAKARFVHERSTLLLIDYSGGSQDVETQKLVRTVRAASPPTGGTVLVGGDTAELVDRLDSLNKHLPIAAAAIIAATFVLLCFMLSSLLVPLKALLLNILSLSASFGAMTWIFQDGHLQRALGFTTSHSLDVTLPVLIFVLAFGLSTDYEVFLVSRIKEEYHRTGNNTESVALGVEKTAAIITSAALLLIVVVGAFGASKILPMKEIGVGLSIAIAIDATVVRMLLVPATMHLFGDWNWWMPGGLLRSRMRTRMYREEEISKKN